MTGMSAEKPATIQDLMEIPKDGQIYELVDGVIVVSPAGGRHSMIALKIASVFMDFLEKHPIGIVFGADVGFVLPNRNLRSPDVSVVRNEKFPGGEVPDSYVELVPDLAVEVLSPADRLRFVAEKIGEYLECGVGIVWLADPANKTVTVYRSLTDARQFSINDQITAEPLLEEFSCPVSLFFLP